MVRGDGHEKSQITSPMRVPAHPVGVGCKKIHQEIRNVCQPSMLEKWNFNAGDQICYGYLAALVRDHSSIP